MRGMIKSLLFLSCILSFSGTLMLAFAQESGGKQILNSDSYWRWHVNMRMPQYLENGKLEELDPPKVWGVNGIDRLTTDLPPAKWAETEFDDSLWPRSRLAWLKKPAFAKYSANRAFLRGKFEVNDPATAVLQLSLDFVGGAIVYVNGKELCRVDMPEGVLSDEATANPYPDEAFVDAEGKTIPGFDARKKLSAEVKAEFESRVAKRNRTLAPKQIPAAMLRKGVNTLAIEIRRAPYHPISKTWFSKAGENQRGNWVTIGLDNVLLVSNGNGAVPNVSRPTGVQLWVQDRSDRVSLADYGDPLEKLQPIRLEAAKNGYFCGQLVLGSNEALTGIKVTPSDLKGDKGDLIVAKDIVSLFGIPNEYRGTPAAFVNLSRSAPAKIDAIKEYGGAVQEILLQVHVPATAKSSTYRGSVIVEASGQRFETPVIVNVSAWTLPDPQNYRTYIGLYQSPISVAMQYDVKPWSEEHWKLMEKSFAMLGRIGNKMINVSVVDETQFGEPEGMINWVKKGENSYDYDFTIFDRYLALATKYCGPLDYICFHIWHSGGWEVRPLNNKCTVTVRDANGTKTMMQVPMWGTPEAVAFWKPFFDQLRARLAAVGMEKALTVGILSCSTAPEEVFTTVADSLPPGTAMWQRGCHVATDVVKPYKVSKKSENLVGLHEHCYGMKMIDADVKDLPPIHEFRGRPGTAYHRISEHEVSATLLTHKLEAEYSIWCLKQGVGRIGLDFWDVMKTKGGSDTGRDVYNRYPHSTCSQREPSLKKLSWPGPDGAETTVYFEAFAEGIQELEAALVVSRGAFAEDIVGKELADKCKDILHARLNFFHASDYKEWQRMFYHLDHYGWQNLAKQTFDAAAEVSAKLK